MAIYNNREVTIVGPSAQANTPETIGVQYTDGTNENVAVGRVRFTEDEKKILRQANPGKFDNVETVKDEDVKAVRLGVAPSYDSSVKEAAEAQAMRQKQSELSQKQQDDARKEAEDKLDKDLKKDSSSAVVGKDREGKSITSNGNVAVK